MAMATATTDARTGLQYAPCAGCGRAAILSSLDLALAEAGVPVTGYCAGCLVRDAEALCAPEVVAQVRAENADRHRAEVDLRGRQEAHEYARACQTG